MIRRFIVSAFTTILMSGSVVLTARDAAAEERLDVRVGTVDAGSTGVSSAAVQAFRQALVDAARDAPSARRRSTTPLLLMGAVTRLERDLQNGGMLLQCEISLVVMDRRGGQVRAMLTGWAESMGVSPRTAMEARQQEEGVVTAAVESALQRLWESLDRSRLSAQNGRGATR